jgi:hypothetical protein
LCFLLERVGAGIEGVNQDALMLGRVGQQVQALEIAKAYYDRLTGS